MRCGDVDRNIFRGLFTSECGGEAIDGGEEDLPGHDLGRAHIVALALDGEHAAYLGGEEDAG